MSQHSPRTPGAGVPPVRPATTPTRLRTTASAARDAGITLVEIVMSVVLSSIIGAVLVATLTTSLNAANSASSTISSSIDSQLVTSFLTADAQAAGGTDPTTAALDLALGVSVVNDVTGWAGCTQSGTLAVRFAWKDRSASATDSVVATYAVLPDGSLVRRACDSAGSSQAVLARGISQVDVTCSPFVTCTGLPDVLSLRLRGGDAAAPFDITLTASLRPQLQDVPTLLNSAQSPLVVTGTGACPVLTLGLTSITNVVGDAVVGSACGASPISGVLTSFGLSGTLSLLGSIDDPLASMAAPASCSGASGANPTIGSSTGPTSVTRYPNAVTISGAVTFQPGRHVFCNGLTIASGATVQGTGVLLYVASGAVSVDAGSTVTLAPATTGTYAGTVLWSAATQAVTIAGGSGIDQLSGVVYVPRTTLSLSAVSGVRVGAVVADRVSVGGTGPVRIGLPIPDLTVAATSLPAGTVGQLYSGTAPTVSGGTAPITYTATGLPLGLVMTTGGSITGAPLAVGSFDVAFLAVDATGASIPFTRTITVTGIAPTPVGVTAAAGDTTALVSWTAGSTSGAPTTTGYTVTATALGFPTRTCTGGPSATSCTLTGLTNGVQYSVSVTATNSIGTSPAATTIVIPRPAVLVATGSQLWLDATDPDGDGSVEGTTESCNATSTCTAVSNVLTRWEDKSGANNDATQSTSSMAGTYVPGMPAVDFDANGFYQATVNAGPDLTAFVVAQSDTLTWNTWGWLLSSRRPNGVIIHPWSGGADVTTHAVNAAGAYQIETRATVGAITSPHVYDFAQTGSAPIVATTFLDGHPVGSQTISGQTRTATSVPLVIGADDFGTSRLGNGKYREVLVFSRTLTATERRAVQEYLARKWSIAVTPSAPSNVSALAANGGALVSWTAPSWNGGSPITGYRVTAWPGGASCTTTLLSTSCAVTGLTNGTAYSFFVNALNLVGTGDQSAASNTITPGPPPAPTSAVVTPGSRQAAVSWTAPVLNGHAPLTDYTVTATATNQTTRSCTATPPTTTCTVTGLTNDVAYTFAIVATNAHGNSPAVTATGTPTWTPSSLGSALTWWYDANDASALTGSWVTQSGFTVSGTAGASTLRVSSGVVERVDVINGGSGFSNPPTVSISGGGGSGAAVLSTTVSSGVVTSVTAHQRGSGYTNEPTVTWSGGSGGTGAVFRARIVANVAVGATIRIGGQTYTVTERDGLTLTVTPPLVATVTGSSIDEWQISTWQNRATPGTRDARQTTLADQPVLGTMAGRPAVVFSGMNSWMSVLDDSGAQTFDHGPNWTVLIAYQAERQTGWGAVPQTTSGWNTRIMASSGGGQADWASAENIQVNPSVGDDALNGGPVRIATVSGTGADTFNWTRVFLAATAAPSYSDGWGFAGRVGEIVFVNGGLDATAVAEAQAYLAAKWTQSSAVPSAPINVTATPTDGQAVVVWRGANQYLAPAITSYTATATSTGQTTRTCTATTTLTCTLTGLTNGAPYSVTVTATSSAGTGPSSVPITVVTRPAILTSTNSRLWLDGADIDGDGWIEGGTSETDVISGAVQTWTDKSGRGNNASATSTATRPSATTQTMNGLPVITFNGTTGVQGATASNPYNITGDRTMFVVTRRRSGSPWRLIDRTPEDNPLFSITGDNRLEVRDDNNAQYQATIGSIGSTANTVTVLTANRSGTSLGIWSNGAPSGTSTITGNQTQRALVIGRHVVSTQATDNDIAEVILFDRALTAAERRTVETYLRRKWGATIAPDAPTAAAATQTRETVSVSWTAPTDDGGAAITGYTVTASPGGATCTTTTTTCSFTGLTPGTSYTFTVTATNTAGTGPASTATASITKNSIVASIATSTPYNTFFDGTWMWVANDQPGTVSKINPTTGVTAATITVGAGPTSFASDGTSLWVTNFFGGTVSRINMSTNAVTATINTGGSPYGIVVNGTDVWVANMNLGVVHRISTATNAITQTVNTGSSPSEMTLAFGSIWVTRNTTSPGRVLRIDPSSGSITATISVGNRPYNLAVEGSSIWVANQTSSNIQEINPSNNSVVTTVSTGSGTTPYDIVFANGRLWVSLTSTDQIVSVDPSTNTLGTPITVGDEPMGITYHSPTNRLWVSNMLMDWVYVVNA